MFALIGSNLRDTSATGSAKIHVVTTKTAPENRPHPFVFTGIPQMSPELAVSPDARYELFAECPLWVQSRHFSTLAQCPFCLRPRP